MLIVILLRECDFFASLGDSLQVHNIKSLHLRLFPGVDVDDSPLCWFSSFDSLKVLSLALEPYAYESGAVFNEISEMILLLPTTNEFTGVFHVPTPLLQELYI